MFCAFDEKTIIMCSQQLKGMKLKVFQIAYPSSYNAFLHSINLTIEILIQAITDLYVIIRIMNTIIFYILSTLKLTFVFINSCAVDLIFLAGVGGNLKLQSYHVEGRNKEIVLVPSGIVHIHSLPSLCPCTLVWSS